MTKLEQAALNLAYELSVQLPKRTVFVMRNNLDGRFEVTADRVRAEEMRCDYWRVVKKFSNGSEI